MKNLFILLFCCLFTNLIKIQAQNILVPDRKDSVAVSHWLEQKNVPALGIGYIEDGKVSWIKLYGTLRTGVPATEDAVFNVASITKTITTMVTLNLVNSGKWQLDGPVARYWTDPDVRDDPRSGKLTTRDILTHRTGFPNWRWDLPGKKLAFQFDPGTKFQYSGEGFEYLRQALEHKFHRSLEQLADSIIFRPLEMKDTHFTWKESDEPRYAYPFDASGKSLDIYQNTTISAADLLKTTIPDYCKFMLWMLRGGGISSKLFAEMVSHQVETKTRSYMGLGWAIYEPVGNNAYAISHGGHDPGVHTMVILLPKQQKAVVIFTNSDNGIKLYADLLPYYLGEAGQAIVDIETKHQP